MTQPSAGAFPARWTSTPAALKPDGRQALMVTWSVEESFGGMTSMCLKRASIFHEHGVPSAVVTFDANPDYRAIHSHVVATAKLHPAVPILNLHEHYSEHFPATAFANSTPSELGVVAWDERSTTRRPGDASLHWIEYSSPADERLRARKYFRRDGSIYLVDCMLPGPTTADPPRHVLQLFGPDGSLATEFSSTALLYRSWLAELVGQTPTDVLVDSKYSAGFLWSWRHPLVTKFVNFHSTHIAVGADPLKGPLSPGHRSVLENHDSWDGITFLTESQRAAFVTRFGDLGNTVVIGNPVDGPTELPEFSRRNPAKVVHVGRMTLGKNVREVIEIVHAVAANGTSVRLDLIGDGAQRANLEALAQKLGIRHLVHFHGHIHTVAEHLAEARVLILCSRHEGQSLAILEAQAAGCVPVAYDVDFGPRDIIDQEATGFLIPFRDQEAAAEAVTRLLSDDELCARMSVLSFESAKKYTSEANFVQWQQALGAARENKGKKPRRRVPMVARPANPSLSARLSALHFRDDGTVDIEVAVEAEGIDVTSLELVVAERGSVNGTRETLVPYAEDSGRYKFVLPSNIRTKVPGPDPLDFSLLITADQKTRTVRLGIGQPLKTIPYLTAYGNLSVK